MEIRIQAVNFDAAERLRAHIEKRLSKLEKLCDGTPVADVTLKVVKPETDNNKDAQIRLKAASDEFFASKTADSFEQAIDECAEAVERQILKAKDKRR
ncbi:MAG: ribosome hibernation-promoting factor, HPF/YfiA family [Paludibacteraceae bacterium]